MYRSPTYASEKSKSVFVEMSQRSAETARLLQQTREPQLTRPPRHRRALLRRAVSQWHHMLQRMGNRTTQQPGEAHS
jgi:hypothetical protein